MFDNDAVSKEDFETAMKISINKAISHLWNYQPWSFRVAKKTIRTRSGVANYQAPNGQLLKKTLGGIERYGIKHNKTYLQYEPSYELLDEDEGSPEGFYISGDTIYIYPTPDASYEVSIEYLKLPYGLDEDGDELYELTEDDDYINIPEKYETLFKNCVISLAMIYAIANETDENHSGYVKQYEDALSVLVDYCKSGIVNKNIVW
jgi:hypothetical protein